MKDPTFFLAFFRCPGFPLNYADHNHNRKLVSIAVIVIIIIITVIIIIAEDYSLSHTKMPSLMIGPLELA